MAGPLTYPPEILIESTLELPPEFRGEGINEVWIELVVGLAASVVLQGSSTGTPVGVNPFGWGNYQVNGSFGSESAEFLDGQPLNIGYINLPILIPTQDSIQEFRVQTSNLGPEWGLGASEKATAEILRPSGVKQVLNDVRAGQFISVREPERT